MENNLNADILDKITKVCTCKSISRTKIKEAIKNNDNEAILQYLNKISNLNNEAIDFLEKDIKLLQNIYDFTNSDIVLSQINLLTSIKDTLTSSQQLIENLTTAIQSGETSENINIILDSLSEAANNISNDLTKASNFYYSSVVIVFNNLQKSLSIKLDSVDNILESTKVIVPELKALSNFMISTNSLSVKEINELNSKVISLNDKLKSLNEK